MNELIVPKIYKTVDTIHYLISHVFIWCLLVPNTVLYVGFKIIKKTNMASSVTVLTMYWEGWILHK